MELNHRIVDNICVISPLGNFALEGVNKVKSYIEPFLDDESVKGMIMNLEEVNFIDSSGIALIVFTYKSFKKKEGKFSLCQLSSINFEIFKIAKLNKILSISDTEEEALSSFEN